MIDYDARRGENKWIYAPKIGGDPVTLWIEKATTVKEEKSRFNFQKEEDVNIGTEAKPKIAKVKTDMGYRFEYLTPDGKILTVSNWGLFFAMDAIKANDGMHIKISHPSRGEWKVENLDDIGAKDIPPADNQPDDTEDNGGEEQDDNSATEEKF